ncbi:MAG TPA: DeoR/GlpR family DNA-binding transcription regulator [Dongiaceae bacterium]|nr:DeoR/GlpR family DNA-binding transcription regulator [Dongiaceae bacterium]
MSETRSIAKRERQRRILAALRASNDLWIPGMVTALDDVRHLHAEGLAERAANAADASAGPIAQDLPAVPQRQQLAALALSFVRPHMVVMIDGGATALDVARRMARAAQRITVITNNLPAATLLSANPTISVTFCPGRYDGDRGVAGGADTVDFLQKFRANLAILGACGIDAKGPSSGNADAAAIKRAMLERAEENVLVLDHTKLDSRHSHTVCPLAEIDHLLCDTRPEGDLRKALLQANVDVS